jgi:hypothetical protein
MSIDLRVSLVRTSSPAPIPASPRGQQATAGEPAHPAAEGLLLLAIWTQSRELEQVIVDVVARGCLNAQHQLTQVIAAREFGCTPASATDQCMRVTAATGQVGMAAIVPMHEAHAIELFEERQRAIHSDQTQSGVCLPASLPDLLRCDRRARLGQDIHDRATRLSDAKARSREVMLPVQSQPSLLKRFFKNHYTCKQRICQPPRSIVRVA